MKAEPIELEGTWEEILTHSNELSGKRVRVVVLQLPQDSQTSEPKHSTLGALLQHAGTWQGDDFEECLQAVYDNRTQAEFD